MYTFIDFNYSCLCPIRALSLIDVEGRMQKVKAIVLAHRLNMVKDLIESEDPT